MDPDAECQSSDSDEDASSKSAPIIYSNDSDWGIEDENNDLVHMICRMKKKTYVQCCVPCI